jgi:tRNA A37 threonylcarbamoyltransferase TsaD
VVPEIAAREHANVIFDVLDSVLEKASITLDQIDAI